jgi:hypothetical protein
MEWTLFNTIIDNSCWKGDKLHLFRSYDNAIEFTSNTNYFCRLSSCKLDILCLDSAQLTALP